MIFQKDFICIGFVSSGKLALIPGYLFTVNNIWASAIYMIFNLGICRREATFYLLAFSLILAEL
jgi:hypothetical protein